MFHKWPIGCWWVSELEIGYGEHIRVVAKWSPSGKQGVTMSGVAGTFSVSLSLSLFLSLSLSLSLYLCPFMII